MLNDHLVLCCRALKFRYQDDYGESHYIGPVEGAQPMSEAWVNGFNHQGTYLILQSTKSGVRSAHTERSH